GSGLGVARGRPVSRLRILGHVVQPVLVAIGVDRQEALSSAILDGREATEIGVSLGYPKIGATCARHGPGDIGPQHLATARQLRDVARPVLIGGNRANASYTGRN